MTGADALSILTADVTNAMQAEIAYDVPEEYALFVAVNEGEETEFRIQGDGTMAFALAEGPNEVSAYYQVTPNLIYRVEKTIYCDRVPPTLVLFEELDGISVESPTIPVLGKVLYGESLTINDEDITLEEDGSFQYEQGLEAGKNVLTLVAKDNNGNGATQVVTVYYGKEVVTVEDEEDQPTVPQGPTGILAYWPLFATVLATGLCLLLVLLLNRGKRPSKKFPIWWIWVLDAMGLLFFGWKLYQYLDYQSMIHSLDFLDMADNNVLSAMTYLKQGPSVEQGVLIAAIALGILVLATVGLCILRHFQNKKKNPPNLPF